MNCGQSLAGYPPLPAGEPRTAPARSNSGGTDWAAIAATALAAVGLSHLSRKARKFGCLLLFFLLFFGGPMACGFIMFVAESLGRLFQ